MMDVFLVLVLAVGLLANAAWTIFLFRKSRKARLAFSADAGDIDVKVERILSEIHRVTSANVELLEGRIDALRDVGALADERLRRLRASLTDLEILLGRVQRVKKTLTDTSA
ncbi:hypothetical protein HY522_04815, partial [bacterium]|nr:hypothetical protein [bacterium]